MKIEKDKIVYMYYPNNVPMPPHLEKLVNIFYSLKDEINSENHDLSSNEVLYKMSDDFEKAGYLIEKSKKREDKIPVPVLFGMNGSIKKEFQVDAYNINERTVVEIEAGRGVTNNQFLKDFFEACMMIDVEYCVIALRKIYRRNKNFEYVKNMFDALYTSNRVTTQLKGVLIIGY